MAASTQTTDTQVLRQTVLGARRLSNYWWASVVTLGGIGFLLAGVSSYLGVNLLPFADPTQLVFVPQGVAMGFYGVAGSSLGTYLWLLILWDVGGGYNEFDQKKGTCRIFRWGFPGKNRKVDIQQPLDSVIGVRVEIREGLNPKRVLYLRMKGFGDIPLTRVGQPLPLSELETMGAQLARFLQVPLEGL